MTPFADLIQQGAAHAWLFVPSAILLGVLHGLEPGHSKTMMAAFIIAVRGTVWQATLLGLAATISHTLVVWAVALFGLHYASQFSAETTEPYLQVASAILIVGIAVWMIFRTRASVQAEESEHHHHDDETRRIDTGHGVLTLAIFEDGVPPRWRLTAQGHHHWQAKDITLETLRPDGSRQAFAFIDQGSYLESVEEIPEPHEFEAELRLGHGDHVHSYGVSFFEREHHHDHPHHDHRQGLDVTDGSSQDAHQLAHAADIKRRFGSRNVTTGQIVMFGLTGGLVPCPAAITVLLLCLQLRQFTLGIVLVLCFSVGLAITMVSSGVIAALSVHHLSKRWSGFGRIAHRAPYLSGILIICVGLYVGWQGVLGLSAAGVL